MAYRQQLHLSPPSGPNQFGNWTHMAIYTFPQEFYFCHYSDLNIASPSRPLDASFPGTPARNIQVWRNRVFSDEGHSVCHKGIEPGLLILRITQHRYDIRQKHTLFQRKIEFSLKLFFDYGCLECCCRFHAMNNDLLQRRNSPFQILISCGFDPPGSWDTVWGTVIITIAGISKMMKLNKCQSSKTLYHLDIGKESRCSKLDNQFCHISKFSFSIWPFHHILTWRSPPTMILTDKMNSATIPSGS